ncbi:MAG: hypothetical protein H0Z28_01350 [Archaeoglobus sp.]|nr:hypothetical protein [Archaeoglobus sp.]
MKVEDCHAEVSPENTKFLEKEHRIETLKTVKTIKNDFAPISFAVGLVLSALLLRNSLN